jgi:hypothetical protein
MTALDDARTALGEEWPNADAIHAMSALDSMRRKDSAIRALLEENERLRADRDEEIDRGDNYAHKAEDNGNRAFRAEAKLAALEAQQRPQIRAVIEANIGNASSPHSWRCENPDRFPGYCRCVDEITDEVVAALTEPVPDTRSEDS